MASYILFSLTSTAGFNRSTWGPGLGSAGGIVAPGNSEAGSLFNGELLTPAVLAALDGRSFDVTSGPSAALAAFGSGGGGTPLFALAAGTTFSANSVVGGTIDLGQSDANWNRIKNLELKLDSDSIFTTVKIENLVDTRLKIGDDVCDLTARDAGGKVFDVDLLGVKRGEVDATLATARLELRVDVWSNTSVGQNSFDIKGTVYDDLVNIGAGKVTGSMFGNKFGQTGYDADGTYDGIFTKTFTNLGAGNDILDSTNAVGDPLAVKTFKTIDKAWGGTGDDMISTGFGNDKLYGDNGSGADSFADPASLVEEVDDDFIADAIGGGSVPTFGAGATVLGTLVDMGLYTISATGGDLVQLKTGSPGTHAGGLGIAASGTELTQLSEIEVDSRGGAEAITFEFKNGAHSVEIDLSAFFSNEAAGGSHAEIVDYTVNLADGSSLLLSATATTSSVPAFLTIVIDEGVTGGELIDSVVLTPNLDLGGGPSPFSDFYVAAVRACTPVPGEEGNDLLVAGAGVDWLEGNGDRGAFVLAGDTCIDFITGDALSGSSVDTGFLLIGAIGGDFAKLGDGATFGGLTVLSGSDRGIPTVNAGAPAFTNEIDAFNDGVAEGVTFTFDGPGVTGFTIDLNLFFAETFFELTAPELADFKVTLEDGSEITGELAATATTSPGLFSFSFDLGDSGGELITAFQLTASEDLSPAGAAYSEFTIAEFCYDGQLSIVGGDTLFVGVDSDKDIVNFNDGDGVDTVFEFDTVKDVVRIEGNEALTTTVVVDSVNGVGTLIEHGVDGDAIFLVGVVDTAAIQIITF